MRISDWSSDVCSSDLFDRLLPVAVIAVLVALIFFSYQTLARGVVPWLLPPTAMLVVVLAFREWWSFRAELVLHRSSEQSATALAASEQEAQEEIGRANV